MTATQELSYRQARLSNLERIKAAPTRFKVCDTCRSIVVKQACLCPFCHCYRLNPDPQEVLVAAEECAQHAFPCSLGYVPSEYRQTMPLPLLDNGGRPQVSFS